MLRSFIVGAVCAGVLGIGAASAQTHLYDDVQMESLAFAGAQRTYGVYVAPSYNADRPAPLIIALHGRFSSAKAFHALSGLRAVADRRGAVLLYPQTAGAYWNDGGFGVRQRLEEPLDDAGFIAASIAAIEHRYAIDPARVFALGYDSGGEMAYRLACEGRTRLRAIATVGALMWDYQIAACPSPGATPLLVVSGGRDEYTPASGAAFAATRRLSLADTLAFWRRANGCAGACAAAQAVTIANGGHNWFRSGPYRINSTGADAAALADGFFFSREAFVPPEARSSGRARNFLVYVPTSYEATRPMPIVLILHGRPGNGTGMALISQMNAVAARYGFIAVYPDGLNNEWNTLAPEQARTQGLLQDDVAFLGRVVDDLSVDLNIDLHRQYVTGFSNGGFMTMRMLCEASGRFAAFAVVGAELELDQARNCRGRAAPALFMNGVADREIPFNGIVLRNPNTGADARRSYGVADTVAFFVRRNHCSMRGETARFAESGQSPGTNVVRFLPGGCPAGQDIALYTINGGGHTWPGVSGALPEAQFGKTNMDINAGAVIWEFFSAHALAQTAP